MGKRGIVIGVIVAGLMALGTQAATATTVPSGTRLSTCAESGGATVPAGGSVNVWQGWLDMKRSSVSRFLRIQNTTATANGSPVANASSLWGPVTSFDSGWATFWSYNVGVLSPAGKSMTVTFDIVLRKRLRDGEGTVYYPGSVYGAPITCVITAV